MDLISIIVPVYNVEKYLKRNLDSLVNQTYKNIEIIVVNDETPDNSEKIIKQYEKKYKKLIKYYKKKNGGLSDARNYGLKYAKGKYVAFVDSDDYVEKDYISELYKKAIEDDCDITVCDIYDEYENTGRKEIYNNYIPQKTTNILEEKRLLLNRFAAWNKLYKISVFGDLKFEKGKIYEDLRLIPKLYINSNKIGYVNKPLYHYIIREGSIMTSSNINKNLDIISAFEDIINYFKIKEVYKDFEDEIEYLCIDHLYIATTVRIIKMSRYREIKNNLKILINFMEEHFPNYRKNKYLKDITKTKKIILKFIESKQYKLLKLLLTFKG